MKKLKKNFSKYNDAGPAFSSFPYMGCQEEIHVDNAHVSESSKRIPLNNKDGIFTDRHKLLSSGCHTQSSIQALTQRFKRLQPH